MLEEMARDQVYRRLLHPAGNEVPRCHRVADPANRNDLGRRLPGIDDPDPGPDEILAIAGGDAQLMDESGGGEQRNPVGRRL